MATYKISDFIYISEKQILKLGEDLTKLDPKVADLLNYFILHAGEVLSREQLLENVWKGTYVSDNTVSWSISQLRKALKDNSAHPIFIQTLPKKGYIFIATVESASDLSLTENVIGHRKKLAFLSCFRLGWAGLLVVAFLVFIYWLPPLNPLNEYKVGSANLLTSMDGLEEDASVSSDGVLLVFRHKDTNEGSVFQVFLKPLLDPTTLPETLENGEISVARLDSQRVQNAYPLTDDEFDYKDIIWGRDSYQLYAVRKTLSLCEIVEFILPVSRDRVLQQRQITTCDPQAKTRLAYSTIDKLLYFTDKRESNSYSVYQLNIDSGLIKRLTRPNDDGLGDHFIDLDIQQSQLLVLRDKNWSKTEFLRLNLNSSEIETLFEVPSFYYSAYWGPQGKSVFYNSGNATVLRFDLATKTSSQLMQTSFGWNYNTRPINTYQIIFSVSDGNSADFLVWDGASLLKTLTPYSEFLPTNSSSKGDLAYVSNQSGLPQIWLKGKDNDKAVQLSNLSEYKEFTDLNWSADGSMLTGITDGVIGAIGVTSQIYQILYQGSLTPHLPRLSANHNLLAFTAQENGEWQLFLHQIDTKKNRKIVTGHLSHWLNNNQILFSQRGKSGLWKYDIDLDQATLVLPEFPEVDFWQIANNTIYFVASLPRRGIYQSPLYQYSPTKLTNLPINTGRQFSVNPIDGSLVIEDWRRLQSDLKIAPLIQQN